MYINTVIESVYMCLINLFYVELELKTSMEIYPLREFNYTFCKCNKFYFSLLFTWFLYLVSDLLSRVKFTYFLTALDLVGISSKYSLIALSSYAD